LGEHGLNTHFLQLNQPILSDIFMDIDIRHSSFSTNLFSGGVSRSPHPPHPCDGSGKHDTKHASYNAILSAGLLCISLIVNYPLLE
jgi:hypothetical protein